jgi:hypothetical protein
MKFILINLDNGFINQNSHAPVFSFSGNLATVFVSIKCLYKKTGQVGFCQDT